MRIATLRNGVHRSLVLDLLGEEEGEWLFRGGKALVVGREVFENRE
jgi:hypothetical protein